MFLFRTSTLYTRGFIFGPIFCSIRISLGLSNWISWNSRKYAQKYHFMGSCYTFHFYACANLWIVHFHSMCIAICLQSSLLCKVSSICSDHYTCGVKFGVALIYTPSYLGLHGPTSRLWKPCKYINEIIAYTAVNVIQYTFYRRINSFYADLGVWETPWCSKFA